MNVALACGCRHNGKYWVKECFRHQQHRTDERDREMASRIIEGETLFKRVSEWATRKP